MKHDLSITIFVKNVYVILIAGMFLCLNGYAEDLVYQDEKPRILPARVVSDQGGADQFERMQEVMRKKFPKLSSFQEQLKQIQEQLQATIEEFSVKDSPKDQLTEKLRQLLLEKSNIENNPEYKVEMELMQLLSIIGGRPKAAPQRRSR